jgi:hypothetical protein
VIDQRLEGCQDEKIRAAKSSLQSHCTWLTFAIQVVCETSSRINRIVSVFTGV